MLNYPHELINLLNSLGNIGNRVVKPGPARTGVRNGDDRCTGRKPGRFCEFACAPLFRTVRDTVSLISFSVKPGDYKTTAPTLIMGKENTQF